MATIEIVCRGIDPDEVRDSIRGELENDDYRARLKIARPTASHRTLGAGEVAIIVATVTSLGAVLSSIISGIFNAMSQRQENSDGRIVIVGKDGTSIECPSGLSESELDMILAKAKALSEPKLEIRGM